MTGMVPSLLTPHLLKSPSGTSHRGTMASSGIPSGIPGGDSELPAANTLPVPVTAGSGRSEVLPRTSNGDTALFVLLSSLGVDMSSGRKLGIRRTPLDDRSVVEAERWTVMLVLVVDVLTVVHCGCRSGR
jgi:hypothetical protein